MSFNAASLRLMAEKGLSALDIAEIAEAAERPRSPAAERQARYRLRKKDGDVTRDVTPLRDPAPNERDILTPTRGEKPVAKATVKKRRLPIPDDWQPREFAIGTESRKVMDGWPPGEREIQREQFIAFHRSKGNTFLDPQDAWSTWTLNTRKWGIGKRERPNGNPLAEAVNRILS